MFKFYELYFSEESKSALHLLASLVRRHQLSGWQGLHVGDSSRTKQSIETSSYNFDVWGVWSGEWTRMQLRLFTDNFVWPGNAENMWTTKGPREDDFIIARFVFANFTFIEIFVLLLTNSFFYFVKKIKYCILSDDKFPLGRYDLEKGLQIEIRIETAWHC